MLFKVRIFKRVFRTLRLLWQGSLLTYAGQVLETINNPMSALSSETQLTDLSNKGQMAIVGLVIRNLQVKERSF